MFRFSLFILLLSTQNVYAQHCPWDCSGMILLKTDISTAEFRSLEPVLVDKDKRIIVDTMYGTGLETYDTCRFLYYDDFLQYRTEKIKTHYWYGYDTAYQFAKEHYLVRFNYCRFSPDGGDKLFVRFNSPSGSVREYLYFEVPAVNRIHLHEHNRMLNDRAYKEILAAIQPQILMPDRKDWGLPDK